MTKTCKGCKLDLPIESFYANVGMKDGRLSWCKTCSAEKYGPGVAKRRRELMEYVQKIKMDRGCADCGYKTHPAALDFDHLPGFEKVVKMSTAPSGISRSRLEAELLKCEVVCANCHRVRTAERRNSGSR